MATGLNLDESRRLPLKRLQKTYNVIKGHFEMLFKKKKKRTHYL